MKTPDFTHLADLFRDASLRQCVEFGLNAGEAEQIEAALREHAPSAGSPASAVTDIPNGATHQRKPEYITAWLNDGKSDPPKWLIEKYVFQGLPAHRHGMYALAIDGEFWRWDKVELFDRMFIPLAETGEFSTTAMTGTLRFVYKNYRNEISEREARPISIRFGSSEYHKAEQWLMLAFDLEKNAEREFAMRDMGFISSSESKFALSAAPVSAWQDVETAPMDVEVLMGWWANWPELHFEMASGLYGSTRGGWLHGQAKVWQPLPASPAPPRNEHVPPAQEGAK